MLSTSLACAAPATGSREIADSELSFVFPIRTGVQRQTCVAACPWRASAC